MFSWHSMLQPIRKVKICTNQLSAKLQNLLYTIDCESTVLLHYCIIWLFLLFHALFLFFQRKERAEQVAYKLEQDLALCKYHHQYSYWDFWSVMLNPSSFYWILDCSANPCMLYVPSVARSVWMCIYSAINGSQNIIFETAQKLMKKDFHATGVYGETKIMLCNWCFS